MEVPISIPVAMSLTQLNRTQIKEAVKNGDLKDISPTRQSRFYVKEIQLLAQKLKKEKGAMLKKQNSS